MLIARQGKLEVRLNDFYKQNQKIAINNHTDRKRGNPYQG